ncbi:MAG: glycosyltransferase [Bacteroidetes bacterium]|nr:glycosyltransferase [Bacteroidota bacterium]
MKVLQVIPNLGTGGAEKLLMDSIPKYLQKGISMELLLLNTTMTPFLDKMQSNGLVTIHQLSSNSVYTPMNIIKLIPFLKAYDLIHVHLFPALYWVGFAKMLSFSKTPLVYTEHNTHNKRRNHWLLKHVDRFVYRKYKSVVTIADAVDGALKLFLKRSDESFTLINNGVDLTIITAAAAAKRSDFSITNKETILIQVASFTEQKDQRTLIQSLKHITNPVKLILVGDGPTRSRMTQLVKDAQLEDKVLFLGLRMDVPQLLKMADIVVLSSHHEGLSLSSIEGLASGAPFVASQVAGLTNIVKGAGLLFTDGDIEGLAAIIDSLIEDRKLYETTIESCLERSKEYTMEIMVDKHIHLYQTLLNT